MFLLGSSGLGVLAVGGSINYLYSLQPKPEMTILQAIIDTIIPADEQPGALETGIEAKLVQFAGAHPEWEVNIPRMVEQSNALAIKAHKQTFNLLDLSQREQLLGSVLKGKGQLQLFIDLTLVRNQILRWYYASPTGHATLDYLAPSTYPAYAQIKPA